MAPVGNKATPAGYAHVTVENFVTVSGKEILEDLLKKAANRNPDAFDMHIYNDFYPCAVLDLVDKTLATLHNKIRRKNWREAYSILEALTVFNDLESSWLMCDDSGRTDITNKVYGACLITVLRALKKEHRLNVTSFPSLETLLRNAAEWGETMKDIACPSNYPLVCKAIGKRLFKDKSNEDREVEQARVEEWIETLDEDDRQRVQKRLREVSKDEADAAANGFVPSPWFHGAKERDEDDRDPDYVLSRIWKEYKEYLSSVPTMPMRGPADWDISKWATEERKEFEFDAGERDEDDGLDDIED